VGRILAVANQKGGVGKTTTVVNLAACLAEAGRRVLVVDADPQANATSGLGLRGRAGGTDRLLWGEGDVASEAVATAVPGLDLVPASDGLAGADITLAELADRERRLRRALVPARDAYDYLLVDCPPSLGLLTVNALAAADGVVVPIQCEYYALEGLAQLMATLERVRRGLNPGLAIEGVVLTMFDARTNLSAQVVDEVKRHFRNRVYGVLIPRLVRLSEAPSHGMPISLYDPRSRAAEVYRQLAEEVMARAEGTGPGSGAVRAHSGS
jgi:chromosome partitioning protein